LEISGFKEVIVVLTKRIAPRVSQYLTEGYRTQGKLKIQVETVADGTDSADALRSIHNHIKVCCCHYYECNLLLTLNN
jgi:NDP-sugar pyrophosphorylase family protein